jgi:hypothetical protein
MASHMKVTYIHRTQFDQGILKYFHNVHMHLGLNSGAQYYMISQVEIIYIHSNAVRLV